MRTEKYSTGNKNTGQAQKLKWRGQEGVSDIEDRSIEITHSEWQSLRKKKRTKPHRPVSIDLTCVIEDSEV